MEKRYEEQVLNDGMDQSAEELVAMRGVDRLVNGEFRREGGISRRKGFEIPTSATVSATVVGKAGHSLVVNGGALAVVRKLDAVNIDAVNDGVSSVVQSFVAPGSVSTAAQLRDAAGFCNANVAVGTVNGVLCACVVGQVASEGASTEWRGIIVEVESGALVSSTSVTGQRPVPIFVESAGNERFQVVYRTNSAADIAVVSWDAATNAWSSASSLLNGVTASSSTYPAVCADPDDAARFYVAFAKDTQDQIYIRRVNFDRTISTSYGINVTEVQLVAMCPSLQPTGHLHIAYSLIGGASVRLIGNLAGSGSATAELTMLTRSSASYSWRHLSVADIGNTVAAGTTYRVIVAGCETTGTFTNGNVRHRDADYTVGGSPSLPTYGAGSERVEENLYLNADVAQLHPDDLAEVAGNAATPALFMSRVTDVPAVNSRQTVAHGFMAIMPHGRYDVTNTVTNNSRLAASSLPGSAHTGAADDTAATYERARLSRVVYDATSRSYFVAMLEVEEIQSVGNIIYGVRVLRYNFSTVRATAQPLAVAQLGDLTYIGGALTRCYDGRVVTEASLLHPPQQPVVAETTGGSLDATSSYTVQAVLLFEDAKGRVHRSAPSPAITTTLTGVNNALTCTFDLDVFPTSRSDLRLRLEVYRSEGNGTALYLDQTVDVLEGNGNTVVTITQPDAVVSTNKLIYTTGDVLASEGAPPARALAAVGNRLFGINAVDPRQIFFSKELQEGYAAEFNAVLSFRCESSKSEPVALGVLNDLLVIFTRDEAWAVSTHGGPDALGAGAFGLPERLSSDCGASSPEAAVSTPYGVLVHGPFGFRLLTQANAVDLPAVTDIATTGSVIQRSIHVPEREECWFVVRDDATVNRVVVFSYARGKIRWSTHEIATDNTALSVRDIANVRGRVWMLFETGSAGSNTYVLRRQSLTRYVDSAAVRPTMKVRVRWFKPEGHLGDSRFWKLHVFGKYGAADDLEADVYVLDTDGSPLDDEAGTDWLEGTYSWPAATLAADDRAVHVVQRLKRQRGSGVRVELRLTPATGAATDPGPVLHAVAWAYGVRGGGGASRGASFGSEPEGGG